MRGKRSEHFDGVNGFLRGKIPKITKITLKKKTLIELKTKNQTY